MVHSQLPMNRLEKVLLVLPEEEIVYCATKGKVSDRNEEERVETDALPEYVPFPCGLKKQQL